MNKIKNYEAIIIGGGPAGISCALELHESRIKYILLERNPHLGGQLNDYQNTIRNFAARFWESGPALRDDMEALCKKIGVSMELSEPISKIDLQTKTVWGSKNTYQGKTIFIATGTRPRMLSIEGAESVKGNVILDVEKNEEQLLGKSVVVIGGGDNALMDCLWLAPRCLSVLLVNRSDRFKARPDVIADVKKLPNVEIITNSQVKSVSGIDGKLENVTIVNNNSGEELVHSADYLAIRVGFTGNSELVSGQLNLHESGLVVIDQSCKTSKEGVFAGGDMVFPECHGIAKSVGDGLIAARSMFRYLINQKS